MIDDTLMDADQTENHDASAYQHPEQMDDYSSYNASSNMTDADNRNRNNNDNALAYYSPTQQQCARGGHSPIQKLNSLRSSSEATTTIDEEEEVVRSKPTKGLDAREDDNDVTDNIDDGGGLVDNVDTTNDVITINGGDGNNENKNESLREQAYQEQQQQKRQRRGRGLEEEEEEEGIVMNESTKNDTRDDNNKNKNKDNKGEPDEPLSSSLSLNSLRGLLSSSPGNKVNNNNGIAKKLLLPPAPKFPIPNQIINNTLTSGDSVDGGGTLRRIRTPTPQDVLSGRGGEFDSHPGNKVFREWVRLRKEDYILAHNNKEKKVVTTEVVRQVQQHNGRFLIKDTSVVGGIGGHWWVEIDERKAHIKTREALSRGATKIRMAHQLAEDADTSTIAATDTITSTAKENKTVKKRRRKNSCSSEVSDASDHTSTMAAEELEVTLPAATPVENVPIENVNRILLPTNHPFRRSTKKSTTTATACTTINNNNESMIKEGTSTSSTLTSSSLSYPPIIMSNKVHSVVVGSPPTMATNATNTAATPRRDRSGSKCTVGDCDKPSRQGGRCDAHGAKRTQCKQPGCTVHAKMAGLCSRHGGRKQCEFEDCDKVARLGRRCYRHRVLTEEQKAETERRIAEKEKIRDDKIAETERRRAEKEKIRDDKKQDVAAERKQMKMVRALAKKILQEQKKQDAVDWKEVDNLTKLSKDGITLSTGNHLWLDRFNNFRNKVKDFVEKSAGKPEGLSIAVAIDGTDMSKSGLFKFKIPNGEATANSILHQCEPIENCVYRNPNATTSSLQVVGEFTSKLPQPFLANRVAVAKTGTHFGKTIARTDNLKVQKYKGPGGEHSDDKFKHIITKPLFGLPNRSLLLCRVLEKPDGGVLQVFREPDKKKFSIRIEKGELLIMMAHAGLCNHKCEKGLYTIVTDFVLPYDAHREIKIHGGLKGKFEKFISDYATSISHL